MDKIDRKILVEGHKYHSNIYDRIDELIKGYNELEDRVITLLERMDIIEDNDK